MNVGLDQTIHNFMEQSIKELREIRGEMANMNYLQLSELEGIVIRYRGAVSMDISQRYTSALLDLSVIQEGRDIDTDLIQSVGYMDAITEMNSAKLFVEEMQKQLDKFSSRIDEIEAKMPKPSEI